MKTTTLALANFEEVVVTLGTLADVRGIYGAEVIDDNELQVVYNPQEVSGTEIESLVDSILENCEVEDIYSSMSDSEINELLFMAMYE